MPAVRIVNGIDPDAISLRQPVVDDVIDLCCVAMFNKWHGYERLLNGLIDYYEKGGQREFKVHMVGEGSELPEYQRIARHPLLNNRVVFYGRLSGTDLDSVYDVADMGVTSLACYLSGIQVGSFLKSREYLLKGMPMVTGCPIDILDKDATWLYLEFANDDLPLDMDRVVRFFDNTQESEITCSDIRQFAEAKVAISVTMKPITDMFLKRDLPLAIGTSLK